MKVYTSYFGNYKKLAENNIEVLCVAIGKPKFLNCPQLLNLCPTRFMISSACSHETYLKMYKEILNRQDAHQVLKQIKSYSKGKDVALCCYEKPDDFCHRHILSEWLTVKTGCIIEEFGLSKNKNCKQGELF